MPELSAFRGIGYTAGASLPDLVCPPYDVISPAEQIRLHERHPHNAVRVELPFSEPAAADGRYEQAGRRFREWIASGVLARNDAPSLYLYRQDYVSAAGERRRIAGIIGALRLEPLGQGSGVLAHERTMPGPIEDRLALLRACPVNISPIYGIYTGRGELVPWVESLSARPPQARFEDDAGTLHRLWTVSSRGEIDMLAGAVRAGPLVIADGHHRYETALAYHVERDGAPGEHDAVMCFCVDAESEDVQVLPYHRAFAARAPRSEIAARLARRFPIHRYAPGEGARALASSRAPHPLLFVFPDRDVLVELSDEETGAGHTPEWQALDVVALHDVVMPRISPEGLDRVQFSSDADHVRSLVHASERTAAVILRPLDAARIIAVARAGKRLPQKASYFWPKALTGLVFRSLE
jgi:uncharacterized protein (DUF1015 family)